MLKLLLLDFAGAGLAKKPWLLTLEAADVCGSALAGSLPLTELLLLDLAGAGLAKKPWPLPLDAVDVWDSALAGASVAGADA